MRRERRDGGREEKKLRGKVQVRRREESGKGVHGVEFRRKVRQK